MSFLGLRTTKEHSAYWRNRKIDWNKDYLQTWNHPHRFLISGILRTIPWISLFEIGCGAGANLVNIIKCFQGKTIQLGGSDINADAIEVAQQVLKGAVLKVGSGDDVIMSDDSTDIVLTDRMLIYVGPRKIDVYIREIKRIAREYAVLCEFHEKNLWKRLKLRFNTGYYSYDYIKLLRKHGFYDMITYRLPPEAWPGDTYPSYIIVAKVEPRKSWK